MINLLRSRQSGLSSPAVIQFSRQISKLHLNKNRKVEQSNIGGVTVADIDATENRYLLSGGSLGGIAIHDLINDGSHMQHTCKCVCRVNSRNVHKFGVHCIQWYPLDTGMFISGGSDKLIKIWDTNRMVPADSYELSGIVYSHHLSPVATLHSLLAVGTQSSRVKLIDLKSGSATHILRGHTDSVLCVQWALRSDYILASASSDGCVLLWDVRRAKGHCQRLENGCSRTGSPVTHDGIVNCVSFTKDGLHVVTVGGDHKIHMWDAFTWNRLDVEFDKITNRRRARLNVAHTDAKSGRLFIPEDSCVKTFDMLTGECVGRLSGHYTNVNCCVYRSDYHELYSGGNDKQVLVWTPAISGAEDATSKCVAAKSKVNEIKQDVMRDEWSSDEEC